MTRHTFNKTNKKLEGAILPPDFQKIMDVLAKTGVPLSYSSDGILTFTDNGVEYTPTAEQRQKVELALASVL